MGVVIGAVITAAASYFGGKKAAEAAAKLTPEQRQLFNQIIANTKSASDFANLVMTLARDPIIGGVNFINSLSSGDRNTINSVIGQDVANIGTDAARSLQTMSQISSRTGASSDFLRNLPTNVAMQQENLRTGVVNQAKFGQLGTGEGLAQTGGSMLNTGQQGNEFGIGTLLDKQLLGMKTGAAASGAINSIGSSIFGTQTSPTPVSNWISKYFSGRSSPATPASGTTDPSTFFGGGSPSLPSYYTGM